MAMKRKKLFYSRKFLNRRGYQGGAHLLFEIERSWSTTRKQADWIYTTFEIADCSRKISLDFEFDNKRQRSNSIAKANLLIQEITKFRDVLVEEAERMDRLGHSRKSIADRIVES